MCGPLRSVSQNQLAHKQMNILTQWFFFLRFSPKAEQMSSQRAQDGRNCHLAFQLRSIAPFFHMQSASLQGMDCTLIPFVIQIGKEWLWKYYTYNIKVYDVWTQKVQTFNTTDPYSKSLAADGTRTQVGQNILTPFCGIVISTLSRALIWRPEAVDPQCLPATFPPVP